jgi:transposase-like protein
MHGKNQASRFGFKPDGVIACSAANISFGVEEVLAMGDFAERDLSGWTMPVPGTASIAKPGTSCSRCGCCKAIIFFDGENLCNRCDDGTHPAVKAALPPLHFSSCQPVMPAVEEMARLLAAPAVARAIQAAAAPAKPREEQPMSANSTSKSPRRISDETRAKVLAASPTVSNCEVARELGISDAWISTFRRQNGIKLARGKGQPKNGAPKKATRPTVQKADSKPELWPVVFDVTQTQLNAWWHSLSIDFQAGIFAANFSFDPSRPAQ